MSNTHPKGPEALFHWLPSRKLSIAEPKCTNHARTVTQISRAMQGLRQNGGSVVRIFQSHRDATRWRFTPQLSTNSSSSKWASSVKGQASVKYVPRLGPCRLAGHRRTSRQLTGRPATAARRGHRIRRRAAGRRRNGRRADTSDSTPRRSGDGGDKSQPVVPPCG